MVNLAVNNELLCRLSLKREGFSCDDMFTVERQIEAMKELEAFIDRQSGGPGEGWYRIVYSPREARRVIGSGKMAVIIGIEVDSLFGCKPNSDFCDEDYIKEQVDYYHDQGVRYIFPVHFFDNAFGGAALVADLYSHANFLTTGDTFETYDCSEDGYTYKIGAVPDDPNSSLAVLYGPLYAALGSSKNPVSTNQADCNVRGLTAKGEVLIKKLMDKQMLIDVDHMSRYMFQSVLYIAESRDYPLISGHAAIPRPGTDVPSEAYHTLEDYRRIRDLGGIASIIIPHGI